MYTKQVVPDFFLQQQICNVEIREFSHCYLEGLESKVFVTHIRWGAKTCMAIEVHHVEVTFVCSDRCSNSFLMGQTERWCCVCGHFLYFLIENTDSKATMIICINLPC